MVKRFSLIFTLLTFLFGFHSINSVEAEQVFIGWKVINDVPSIYSNSLISADNGDLIGFNSGSTIMYHYVSSEKKWYTNNLSFTVRKQPEIWGDWVYLAGNTYTGSGTGLSAVVPTIKRYNILTRQLEDCFNADNLKTLFSYPTDSRTGGIAGFSMWGENGNVIAMIQDASIERVVYYSRALNTWSEAYNDQMDGLDLREVMAGNDGEYILANSGDNFMYSVTPSGRGLNWISRNGAGTHLLRSINGLVALTITSADSNPGSDWGGFLDKKNMKRYWLNGLQAWKEDRQIDASGNNVAVSGSEQYIGALDTTGGVLVHTGDDRVLLLNNGGSNKEATLINNWTDTDLNNYIEQNTPTSPLIKEFEVNNGNLQYSGTGNLSVTINAQNSPSDNATDKLQISIQRKVNGVVTILQDWVPYSSKPSTVNVAAGLNKITLLVKNDKNTLSARTVTVIAGSQTDISSSMESVYGDLYTQAADANSTMNTIISPKLDIVQGAVQDASGNTALSVAQLAKASADSASTNALNAYNAASSANTTLSASSGVVQDGSGTVLQASRQAVSEIANTRTDLSNQMNSMQSSLNSSITNIQNYMAPTLARVSGYNAASVISGAATTFKVSLDYAQANEYQVKLDNGSWSSWTSLSSHDTNGYFTVSGITTTGIHTIYVQIRYNSGASTSPVAKGKMTFFKI